MHPVILILSRHADDWGKIRAQFGREQSLSWVGWAFRHNQPVYGYEDDPIPDIVFACEWDDYLGECLQTHWHPVEVLAAIHKTDTAEIRLPADLPVVAREFGHDTCDTLWELLVHVVTDIAAQAPARTLPPELTQLRARLISHSLLGRSQALLWLLWHALVHGTDETLEQQLMQVVNEVLVLAHPSAKAHESFEPDSERLHRFVHNVVKRFDFGESAHDHLVEIRNWLLDSLHGMSAHGGNYRPLRLA